MRAWPCRPPAPAKTPDTNCASRGASSPKHVQVRSARTSHRTREGCSPTPTGVPGKASWEPAQGGDTRRNRGGRWRKRGARAARSPRGVPGRSHTRRRASPTREPARASEPAAIGASLLGPDREPPPDSPPAPRHLPCGLPPPSRVSGGASPAGSGGSAEGGPGSSAPFSVRSASSPEAPTWLSLGGGGTPFPPLS